MLSINIPIYNYYVDNLVAQLINQIEKLDVPCEIRLYDDGSSDEFVKHNATLANNEYVIFKAMNKNMGRSAIRNKMGQESKYQYLLFIDADSKLISDSYLQNYLDKIDKNTVLCGGTAYSSNPPTDKSKMLRWKYGCVREAIAAEQRNSKKGFIITSNNFLIEKSIFTQTLFREEIQKYGHEDTLLGFDLFKKGVAIKHINNAVEHTGLESAEQFIAKTRKGLENLKYIDQELLNQDKDFGNYVFFIKKYKKLMRYIPPFMLKFCFRLSKPILLQNIKGSNPRLAFFDAYKVGYYGSI